MHEWIFLPSFLRSFLFLHLFIYLLIIYLFIYLSIYLFSYLLIFLPVNICEKQKHTITCSLGKILVILQASYGRHDWYTCPNEGQYTTITDCHSENSHAIVEATCSFKHCCELFADNSVFGEPCPKTFKYLMVKYQCAESFVLCEGRHGILSCPLGQNITLLSASYGRHDRATCDVSDTYMTQTNCHYGKSHLVVEEKCNNKPSCELYANNSVFDEDPCPGTYKYLRVAYKCS